MPPRTTRKSNRPRASDRSMVDTVQPQGLLSFRNRSAASPLKKMQLLRWNNADPIPRARHQTSVFYGERGWMSRKFPRLPVEGEVFSLTSPFIDQAIALIDPLVKQHCDFSTRPAFLLYGSHALPLMQSATFSSTQEESLQPNPSHPFWPPALAVKDARSSPVCPS